MPTQARKSGDPAKKAAAKKPPSKRAPSQKAPTKSVNTTGSGAVSAFKNIAGGAVTLPSGVTVKMRTPGMGAFVTAGLIPNSLLPLIEEAMKGGGTGLDEEEIKERLGVSGVNDMMTMIDNVTIHCMVEPKCHVIPLDDDGEPDEDQRDDNLLYIDEVPFDDKIFIYQFAVGGTRDVERFREELASSLDGVPDGQEQLRQTKRASRRR